VAIRRGIVYLNRSQFDLRGSPHETVGFELIFPELLRQARTIGLQLPYADWEFVDSIRREKLRRIPPRAVYGGITTLSFSIEYLGEALEPRLIERCQASNGSFGASPSATAYASMQMQNHGADEYVRQVTRLRTDGGIVDVYPINVFEIAWCLQSLLCARELLPEFDSAVKSLSNYWSPTGVGHTSDGMIPDSDDTATVLFVLMSAGYYVDPDVFRNFEEQEHFICFPYERNESVRANAAIAESLGLYKTNQDVRRMIMKSVRFIRSTMSSDGNWTDKWHISPFYSTLRCISAIRFLDREATRRSIAWVLKEQRESGAWGIGEGTPEETAYALESLVIAAEVDASIAALVRQPVYAGYQYLEQSVDSEDYVPMWIGKTLYTPYTVVRAAVIGGLIRAHRFLWPDD
jgi:halimadienyl-diphosphate synthase